MFRVLITGADGFIGKALCAEMVSRGTLIMCGLSKDTVVESINIVTSQFTRGSRTFKIIRDYDTDNVSKKVLRIVMSYTGYVNRTVWHK